MQQSCGEKVNSMRVGCGSQAQKEQERFAEVGEPKLQKGLNFNKREKIFG